MDPLSAVALAGTVVQFVDFSSKLVSQSYQLYTSTHGQLTAHQELELITTDLRNVILRIQISSAPWRSESSTSGSLANSNHVPISLALEGVCGKAIEIAQEILTKLGNLKLNLKPNSSKFETFQQVCGRVWNTRKEEAELERLLKRLEALKDLVDRELLVVILNDTRNFDSGLSSLSAQLDRQTALILNSLTQNTRQISQEIRYCTAQLLSRYEGCTKGEYRQNRSAVIPGSVANSQSPASIIASVEMFTVSEAQDNELKTKIQESILQALTYPAMSHRYESLHESHPDSLEWAFCRSAHLDVAWTNLTSWFKTGSGIYWVGGKPGSGKSTLMKRLCDDPRTTTYLLQWANAGSDVIVPLRVATFFFWNSGTPEQRSLSGMLRSLLFQILDQERDLIPLAFPKIWATQYSMGLNNPKAALTWVEPLRLLQLTEALKDSLAQKVITAKFCLMVDGLDEFDGDHEALADLFSGMVHPSSDNLNVKICLASRPLNVYRETFSQGPSLQLQDHTFNDIQLYVVDRLNTNMPFQKLAGREAETANKLAREIVDKAEGVFIWVYIVVRDLLQAVRNRDSIQEIWKRLHALPRDLEPLYDHMKSQIDKTYLPWSSKMFQIVRARLELGSTPTAKLVKGDGFTTGYTAAKDDLRGGCVTILDIFFALGEGLNYEVVGSLSEDEIENKCQEIEFHIAARCACLLEVRNTTVGNKVSSESLVHYLHRTAKDYIQEERRWVEVLDFTRDTAFNPYRALMQCKSFALYWSSLEKEHLIYWPEDEVMLDMATQIFIFASYADSHTVSHVEQEEILNNTANILSKHKIPLKNWPKCENQPGVPPEFATSFFRVAINLNLSGYVSRRLRKIYRLDPVSVKFTTTCFLSQIDKSNLIHVDGLPHMSIDMARALISCGADVNYTPKPIDRCSTWQHFLERNIPNENYNSVSDTNQGRHVNPDLIPLINLFLSKGANPAIIIDINKPLSGSYLHRYVRPHFPLDADRIEQELEERLQVSMQLRPSQIGSDQGSPHPTISPQNNVNSHRGHLASRNSKNSRLKRMMGKLSSVPGKKSTDHTM